MSEEYILPLTAIDVEWSLKNGLSYITPQMYGAKGNGEADDTSAIRDARDAAVAQNKALFFPAGTYIVSGTIELWSDCEIYGEGSKSIIKKTPAYTEVLKSIGEERAFVAGQTTFAVANGSKYTVGQDCYMGVNFENMEGMCGRIASIAGNNVTVNTYPKFPSAGDGTLEDGVPTGRMQSLNSKATEVVLSTSFPVFCSHRRKEDGSWNVLHDVYIHDLTIDGNRQDDEAKPYSLSAIHFDPLKGVYTADSQVADEPNTNIRLENLNIYNSPADGISIQSSKNVSITNCITENCGYNGIHLGVGTEIASIVGCKLNADFCGYFDCSGVNSVSLSNNHFENCPTGIGGLDTRTRGFAVTGNTFRGCGVGIKAGATKNTDALIEQFSTQVYAGTPDTGITICNNTFYGIDLTGVGISFVQGHYFTVNGNTFRDLAVAMEMGDTSYVHVSDNIFKDCAVVLAMGTNDGTGEMTSVETTNSAFVNNIVYAEAEGASAAVVITCANNMRVGGNIGATISIGENATDTVEEDKFMAIINEKLDQMLQIASFHRASGEFDIDNDVIVSAWTPFTIPEVPAGAQLVVVRAENGIKDRILGDHATGDLNDGIYTLALRATFAYDPLVEKTESNPGDGEALVTFYSCSTKSSTGVKSQTCSMGGTNAQFTGDGFEFNARSMLAGTYYWTAYYWDE